MAGKSDFVAKARLLAASVKAGTVTQDDAEFELGLTSGERLAANGVIVGSAAALDIARFGADQTDNDYPAEG
jgi:hypothetical protein